MAGSGIGRGRGWLNINKTQNVKPGSIPAPNTNTANYEHDSNITVSTTSKINPKYSDVIKKINFFDENDDGILLNQKLKHIVEELNNSCLTADDVLECFNSINDHCLQDIDFAKKLIGVATTVSFHNLTIHDVRVRNRLIAQFQKNFENCKQLHTTNPAQFRITVNMLGDYFHKVRLRDGTPFKVFTSPMIQYLNMLLESNNEADLELFTIQLFMNGNELKDLSAPQVSQILLQVRNVLATNEKLSTTSKLWLMLALDISNKNYSILPQDIHQFYTTQLGEDAMSQIKKLTTELSIQVSYENMKLDSHQSNVNVLQKVQNKPKKSNWDSKKDEQKPTESHKKFNTSQSSFSSSDGSFNNIGTWEQPKEKTPRPILGVGARLKHEEKNSESSEWNETTSGWDNKKKEEGSWGNKHKKNIPKGWEHDDRLENDYN